MLRGILTLTLSLCLGAAAAPPALAQAAAPVTEQLYYGQPLRAEAQRRAFELHPPGKPARAWALFCDETLGVVSTRSGKPGATGAVRVERFTDPDRAAARAAKLVAAKLAEGYVEVNPA